MPVLDTSETHLEEHTTLPVDRDEQLATRAAWLYFVAGLTQVQIAKKLGVNRIRVNRLLAQAREQGMVQIRITGRLAECVALEDRACAIHSASVRRSSCRRRLIRRWSIM